MDAMQVQNRCDDLHTLVTDLAVSAALAEVHQANGVVSAVEGCQQTGKVLIARIREQLNDVALYFEQQGGGCGQ
jgi:hypothetical protein